MKTFYIQTLGCKVNQYESDGIAMGLETAGWKKAGRSETADLFIVNTCSVTSKAGMQSRQTIRKMLKHSSAKKIIVTGCHAQTDPEDIKKIDSELRIVSHCNKAGIASHIENILKNDSAVLQFQRTDFKKKTVLTDDSGTGGAQSLPAPYFSNTVTGDMTRAYLKIQDGCEAFCTYCIVPYARGRCVSMPESLVFKHLRKLNAQGFREVILTGIHTGMYGSDFKENMSLSVLLEKINREKPVHRIRLSSIEPAELSDDIIDLAADGSILCDHFHIPLQSGDNNILKRMKRPYDSGLFENLIHKVNQKLPSAGIGVDCLIGFPGETDRQFKNTYKLIERLPVSYLHIFPFSPRKGTPAWQFKDKVHNETIKERCEQMKELDQIKRREFICRNRKRKLEGLVQHKTDYKTGRLKAVTSNYLNILLCGSDDLKGKIVDLEFDTWDSSLQISGKILSK